MTELLKRLTETPGVSGFEAEVRKILEKEFRKYCDAVSVDKAGNLIGRKGKGKPRLMVVSHMDEVGLVVSAIEAEGFLRFAKMGYISDVILPGQSVIVWGKRGPVPGIVGITMEQELGKNLNEAAMFIDIGVASRREAERLGVEIESQVTFDTHARTRGTSFFAKALDDRIGCYILCQLMKQMKKPRHEVYFVANAVEEVGLKGAYVSTYKIDPDAALVVDTSGTEDFPGGSASIKLGGGPVLALVEAGGEGLITDRRIKELLLRAAKKTKIKVQLEVTSRLKGGVTEGTTIQLTRAGVPTGAVNIPIRYPHSVASVINLDDVHEAVTLLARFVQDFRV